MPLLFWITQWFHPLGRSLLPGVLAFGFTSPLTVLAQPWQNKGEPLLRTELFGVAEGGETPDRVLANPNDQDFPSSWRNAWAQLFSSEPPVPPSDAGSRNPEACPVAPYAVPETAQVWSDRPMLVWRGNSIRRIGIRQRGGDEPLWVAEVGGTGAMVYPGEALQPGETYEWLIYLSPQGIYNQAVPFQVMTAAEQAQLAQELEQLEARLVAVGAGASEISLQRADFFADRQLWADFWWEILMAEPSPELSILLTAAANSICQPANSTAPAN